MIKHQGPLKPIPNWEEHTCFACGPANTHGLQMKFFTDDRRLYSFLEVPATMIGWDRIVHGGVLSTILDEIMAWAAIYLFKQLGVTRSITVDFVKPVRSGEKITAVAGLQERISDTEVSMSADIYDAGKAVCARATGRFKMISPKAAVRLGIVGKDYIKAFSPILEFDYDG